MTTEEIKQQAHKEFDENFSFADIFEDSRKHCDNVQNNVKLFIDSLIDKTVQICEENQDSEGIAKHERLIEAVKNNEDIFISENGYALSSEDYYNFEEWVESVGKPEGSTVEKFTRYTITNKSDINK